MNVRQRHLSVVFVMSSLLALSSTPACIFDDESDVAGLIASQFVSIRLTQQHIGGGTLTHEAAVNPDTFLSNLRQRMGRSPTSVELLRIGVAAGTSPVGLDNWSDVFAGDLTVFLVVDGSPPIVAGTLTVPTSGLLPIGGTATVKRVTLDTFPDIAAGRFSVRLSGPTTRAVEATFDLPTRVELEFIAY